jgi:hypothetical protein
MPRKNYISILDQLLQKLQRKLKKEQLLLEQFKAEYNPLKRLNQEQQVCLIQFKIKNTQCYLEQLNSKNEIQRTKNQRAFSS